MASNIIKFINKHKVTDVSSANIFSSKLKYTLDINKLIMEGKDFKIVTIVGDISL